VTRRIYFKDFSASGCREPFSLRQGRLDDLTTSRLGDGAHPNPKSPAKGGAKHPRDFCGTLPSLSVLFCARRSQRPSSTQFSINSSLTESGSYKTGSQPRFALTPPGRPYKADFNVCIDSDGLPVPLRFAHQIVEVAATKVLILRRVQCRMVRVAPMAG